MRVRFSCVGLEDFCAPAVAGCVKLLDGRKRQTVVELVRFRERQRQHVGGTFVGNDAPRDVGNQFAELVYADGERAGFHFSASVFWVASELLLPLEAF